MECHHIYVVWWDVEGFAAVSGPPHVISNR